MTKKSIPMVDLVSNYKKYRKRLLHAIDDVLQSGKYILGPKVSEFENNFAHYIGNCYAIGVNSGTDALKIALSSLGIAKNDEVITTAFSFVATAEVIAEIGARPVFVDIEPDTFTIDPARIEQYITPRTKAILPVHLFGHPCHMNIIMEICKKYNLYCIEDVAQACGSRYTNQRAGSFGDLSCFSFYPTKNLFAHGDAGLITTNNKEAYEKCKIFRNHGIIQNYESEFLGYNSRLDSLQAVILLTFLPQIEEWNTQRRKLASLYNKCLTSIPTIGIPVEHNDYYHVYNQFTIRVKNNKRDYLKQTLTENAISTTVYYPVPLHLIKPFAYLGYGPGDFPEAEQAAKEVLSLPLWHSMPVSAVRHVCSVVKKTMHQCR